eukprot:m.193475 g.193475  ORF g.193475 m.193475 type:complete len:323 (-) comp15666_c0_seq15:4797-5765(-)
MALVAKMTGSAIENKDYYGELEVTRDANDAALRKAYRRLALEFHPGKSDAPDAANRFLAVNEAFEVLSNKRYKATYDQFGSRGLQEGAPKGKEGFTEAYVYHGDAMETFRSFFGGENPFHDLFPPADEFGVVNEVAPRTRMKQNPPLIKPLVVSLEEAYLGCVKKMRVQRDVMNDDGYTSMIREKILTIHVKPGWKEGTRITFEKEGDQEANGIPADIVFVLEYKKHPLFTREGNDLVHTAKVSLANALTGCEVRLTTLDGRILNLPINDVVRPGFERRVVGEGMPITKSPGQKGDLILRFETQFPSSISEEGKALIRQALR